MMKKEYSKPEVLTVVADVAETILAGSPGLSETSADPSQPSLSRDVDDLFANDNLY